jgi:hypothetical protein
MDWGDQVLTLEQGGEGDPMKELCLNTKIDPKPKSLVGGLGFKKQLQLFFT